MATPNPEKPSNSNKSDELEVMVVENVSQRTVPTESMATQLEVSQDAIQKLERRLVRRIDLLVLPLLALSIMMGYLDRGNIGNARVLGMQEQLGLTDQQFQNAVMMFC